MKRLLTLSTTSLMCLGSFLTPKLISANESATSEFKPALIQSLECRRINRNYVTVATATRNSVTTATHFIIWRTTEFSASGYTPQRRCREVTSKLKEIIARNGGSLNGVLLTTGRADRYRTLRHVDNSSAYDNDHFLFHISGKNSQNPDQLIAKLLSFNVVGSTLPIVE